MKSCIDKSLENRSGIYKIINTKNGRIYIGSAKKLGERRKRHLSSLKSKKHRNKFLQNDFNKCGKDVFEFYILEIIQEKENLLNTEQKYLDQYCDNQNMCYNICSVAGNTLGYKHTTKIKKIISTTGKGRKLSQETKRKIANAHKGKILSEETKRKIGLASRGRRASKGTKEKLSKANSGRNNPFYGKTHSEKTKQKLSKSLSGKNNPNYGKKRSAKTKKKIALLNAKIYDVKIISPEGKIFGPIFNLTEFCREHSLDPRNMNLVVNKKKGYKSHRGWKLSD